MLSEEEAKGPAVDYSQDYRRYAYRDFAFHPDKLEGGIRPQALLKWVTDARPRNQDDVVPIMQLCKGILRDLMEERIAVEQDTHDSLQRQAAELRRAAEERAAAERRLATQVAELQAQLRQVQDAAQQLRRDADLAAERHAEQLGRERAEHREALARAQSEGASRVAENEKRLRAAETVAEHRTRDFYKAHGALAARMQMKPREVVASWSLDDQREALRVLLAEHRRCVESLRAADFGACAPAVRRDLVRKLLEATRAASASWLAAVAEVFDAPVPEFYRRVAGWYEQERIVTDDVRYRRQVETFKGVIEGTDLTPLYDVFREGVRAGKYSIYELVFNCSGRSPEETMESMTGMTLDEVALFKENREAVVRFVQTRRSVAAREREESTLKRGLGFLHHGVAGRQAAAVEPMEVGAMYALVARVFSRKIAADASAPAAAAAAPPVNIMRVTRAALAAPPAGAAEARLAIARLVKGVRAHADACPRLRVFGVLAGMDEGSPWLERACTFAMAFLSGVVAGLWDDPDLLADHARRHFLARPDPEAEPGLDRVEWALTDHDVRVPVALLLKAAMSACELHPCGCGYPRDQIQRIVDAACAPPAEYAEAQGALIQEARKRLKRQRALARQRAEDLRLEVPLFSSPSLPLACSLTPCLYFSDFSLPFLQNPLWLVTSFCVLPRNLSTGWPPGNGSEHSASIRRQNITARWHHTPMQVEKRGLAPPKCHRAGGPAAETSRAPAGGAIRRTQTTPPRWAPNGAPTSTTKASGLVSEGPPRSAASIMIAALSCPGPRAGMGPAGALRPAVQGGAEAAGPGRGAGGGGGEAGPGEPADAAGGAEPAAGGHPEHVGVAGPAAGRRGRRQGGGAAAGAARAGDEGARLRRVVRGGGAGLAGRVPPGAAAELVPAARGAGGPADPRLRRVRPGMAETLGAERGEGR